MLRTSLQAEDSPALSVIMELSAEVVSEPLSVVEVWISTVLEALVSSVPVAAPVIAPVQSALIPQML